MEWSKEKIKKAVKDFNEWQGNAYIMVDQEDGSVWTDCMIGEDWKEYHSKSISQLYSKVGIYHRDDTVTEEALKALLSVEAYKYSFDGPLTKIPNEVSRVYFDYGL